MSAAVAVAFTAAMTIVGCSGGMAETSDPVKDPAHLQADQAPVIRAPDLTATERVIKLAPPETVAGKV